MFAFASFAYLVAAVCFIMALRGLSSPETAQDGNRFGMIGMGIAIVTTLIAQESLTGISLNPGRSLLIILGIGIGGSIGYFIAQRIKMTDLPQLVAAFHSLVGLAAVFVAAAAFYSPESYRIGEPGAIHIGSLIEMSLGVAIGAVTFTGSVVAFLKLDGRISGKPLIFEGQHKLNAGLGGLLVFLVLVLCITQSETVFWMIIVVALALGLLLILPIGGADMPVVVSMLNSYSGWAAAGIGFTLQNNLLIVTGALVGASGAILSYKIGRAHV